MLKNKTKSVKKWNPKTKQQSSERQKYAEFRYVYISFVLVFLLLHAKVHLSIGHRFSDCDAI